MARRQVALGDGKEAGESRFGSQQVVAALIEGRFRHPVADRHEIAPGIGEKVELHGQRQLRRLVRQLEKLVAQVRGMAFLHRGIEELLLHRLAQRLRPIADGGRLRRRIVPHHGGHRIGDAASLHR